MIAPAPRRRLTPEVRRDQILDEAARLVLAQGVSAVTMERLSREASVSRALLYAYFPSAGDLLGALLLREHRHFQTVGRALIDASHGLRDSVRATTAAYLDHVVERGELIERLMNEPGIAVAIDDGELAGREGAVAYFGRRIARYCGLPESEARTVAELLMGLTGAAGTQLRRTGGDRADMLDLVVSLLFAALDDLARR